ncbi:hypothetical protein GUITHDRAFT_51599, partial [Guillardia theta CCMP2712]
YTGGAINNQRSGVGVQNYLNGDEYFGEWKNNLRHGVGTIILAEKSERGEGQDRQRRHNARYKGEWREGEMHGFAGTMVYHNGCEYVGEFERSRRSGFGCLTSVNGVRYEGEWRNDLKHGAGLLLFG